MVVVLITRNVVYVGMKADFAGHIVDIDLLGGHRERIQGNEDVVQTKPLNSLQLCSHHDGVPGRFVSACLPQVWNCPCNWPQARGRRLDMQARSCTATTPRPGTSSQEF
jgi:hypothetical protein